MANFKVAILKFFNYLYLFNKIQTFHLGDKSLFPLIFLFVFFVVVISLEVEVWDFKCQTIRHERIIGLKGRVNLWWKAIFMSRWNHMKGNKVFPLCCRLFCKVWRHRPSRVLGGILRRLGHYIYWLVKNLMLPLFPYLHHLQLVLREVSIESCRQYSYIHQQTSWQTFLSFQRL